MKKMLALAAAAMLAGAGCNANVDVEPAVTTPNVDANAEVHADMDANADMYGDHNDDMEGMDAVDDDTAVEAGTSVNAGVNVTVPAVKPAEPKPTPAPTPAPAPAAEAALNVTIKTTNFAFEPKAISAKAGQKVNITFATPEGVHSFVIDGLVNQAVSADGKVSFTAPTAPGNYPFYCGVGPHRSLGMEGTLIVK